MYYRHKIIDVHILRIGENAQSIKNSDISESMSIKNFKNFLKIK